MSRLTAAFAAEKKSNKGFMILSFFGILFVLDAHIGTSICFFSGIFPYDSFFMPMFVFISGYFYRESHSDTYRDVIHYTIHKAKRLLIPYLFWVFAYGILTTGMRRIGIIKFGGHSVSVILREVLTSGWSYGFNDPSWFVPLLFCVCVLYCFLRKVFGKCWNDWAAVLCLIVLGAWAVFMSKTGFNTPRHYMLLKVAFFLQFYHIGLLFQKHLEIHFDRINALLLCVLAAAVNIILLRFYGDSISFPNCASMENFRMDNLLLPLLTSLTGIAFWLKISKVLIPVLGGNGIVHYISSNTFFIMTHHLLGKWIFHGLLLVGKKFGMPLLAGVDSGRFVSDPWYMFGQRTWISAVCYLFMLAFCVSACMLYHKIKMYIFSRLTKAG